MPLTADEKARIRMFLGYPSINRSSDVALEGAMGVVDSDDATLVLVRELLAELAALDTALAGARTSLKVAKVDSIHIDGAGQVRALRAEGRRYVTRLARLFDVRPLGAAYGGGTAIRVGRV